MKTKFILVIAAMTFFNSCSSEDETISNTLSQTTEQVIIKDPLTPQQINAKIDDALNAKGSFNWSETTSHFIWSASKNGDNLISIGYGITKDDFDKRKSAESQNIRAELLQIIIESEGSVFDSKLISDDDYLNIMDLIITKQETIIALRNNKNLRYIEPANYKYFSNSISFQKNNSVSSSGSSGCGYESEILNSNDYTTVTPNAKVPWTFYHHNITSAWNYSTGAGVTIGIVDTGTSPNQSLLGANFNNGLSSGRSIQKYGVYVDSVWPWATTTDGPADLCGHGTSMASVAAAPRNSTGMPVGVAYNSNLITYRAASNVVLDGSQEQNGVKNAFTALANNTNVKIISMSMGHVFSVGKIEDAVKYAYSKGKLIFCAAGTSTSFTTFVGVIFPASMAETVAVTGIKEGAAYVKCDVCHSGDKVEFTVQMQRSASGNAVPVNSYSNAQTDYVGGSSVATATTAGIAALVWSIHPTWSRAQVLTKMRQSASSYPVKNPEFGYGNINALLAVQ